MCISQHSGEGVDPDCRGCRPSCPVGHSDSEPRCERHSFMSPVVMSLLLCGILSFNFSVAHVPGVQNIAADAVSRSDLSRFHYHFPQVQEHTVPPELVSPLLQRASDWNSHSWMAQWRTSLLSSALLPPQLQPITPRSRII